MADHYQIHLDLRNFTASVWINHEIKITTLGNNSNKHFNGNFQGQRYDSDLPPRAVFPNSKSCANFSDFISETILGRVRNGSLTVWGEVGKVTPPYLVMRLSHKNPVCAMTSVF